MASATIRKADGAAISPSSTLDLLPPNPPLPPNAPLQTTLSDLPFEVLACILRWLPSPEDVSRVDCVATLFRVSLVEQGLLLRAVETGRSMRSLPEGESSWKQWLLRQERHVRHCLRVCEVGPHHSGFVSASGELLMCGTDHAGWGYLGQGVDVRELCVPRPASGLGGVKMRSVAVGALHTVACCADGLAYSFGSGSNGALGHGGMTDHHTARVVAALQGTRISMVAVGVTYSLVLSGEPAATARALTLKALALCRRRQWRRYSRTQPLSRTRQKTSTTLADCR